MYEIIPGILEKDWAKIEEKLESLKGLVKTVQIDVIDGEFTNAQTFLDPTPFSKYKDDFVLEAHFIAKDPIKYLDSFYRAGFKRFIGQIEKMSDQIEFIAKGELLGEVGLSIDLDTELEKIKVDLFDLDCITIMTVKAGASGQEFSRKSLGKISDLFKKLQEHPLEKKLNIEIDGGINEKTLLLAKEAGADRFVVNSYLFNGEISDNLKKIKLLLG